VPAGLGWSVAMSMYSTTHQVATPLNGIGGMNDGSGTINPAALNSSGVPCRFISLSHWYQLGQLCLNAPSFRLTDFIATCAPFQWPRLTSYVPQLCSPRLRPHPVLEASSEAVLPISRRNHGLAVTMTVRVTSPRYFHASYKANVHSPFGSSFRLVA
jgi:hypothetical protein